MNAQSKPDGTTKADNQPQPDKVSQRAVENIQAGGNINVGDISQTVNQFFQQQNDLVKRENLEEYTSPNFPSPIKINSILTVLQEQRLLVLGGNHPDKSDLACHIAVKLGKAIQTNSHSVKSSISIWESKDNSNSQSLLAAIRGEGIEEIKNNKNATNIFLLADIQLQQKLEGIQKAAETGKNYVIATTSVPINMWTSNQKQSVWWQLSDEHPLYQPQDLLETLIFRLQAKKFLTEEIISNVRQIVSQQLETVASIDYFIQLLLIEQPNNTLEEKIRKAIDIAKQDREISLKEWFFSLTSRDKLLALSLSFFDGLFADQFFSALEYLAINVWQQRESTLRALDYDDLQKLGNYFDYSKITVYENSPKGFKFVKTADYPTEVEISRIEIRNPHDRLLLLKVAWETHRRQIINALKVIVQMVNESVTSESSNWELYGNYIRCKQLRNTISQTFCDIGLVSISAFNEARNPLLQLASSPDFEVQKVAALAVARWYVDSLYKELSDNELSQIRQRFYGTLQRFWSISIEKQSDTQKTEIWRDSIGATVALTISYAGANVFPDRLSQEFLNWLQELSESPSPTIRNYFGYHTLSFLVPPHLNQLHQMLKEWTQKHQQLNYPIAVALARAYKERPSEVQPILESWYSEGKNNISKSNTATEITKNERLLATIALTYGEIEYD